MQPDLGRSGGLLEGKKIAALAEAFGAQLAPHCYHGPIGLAANIQLATCSPNLLILECIQDVSGFHADLLRRPITWEAGRVIPSTEPGLGVELNEEVALRQSLHGRRDAPVDVERPARRDRPVQALTGRAPPRQHW